MKLINLYTNIIHRFDELRANPSKAKKPHHRPKSAREFATKYLQGYYSVIEDTEADAKESRK